MGRVGRRRIRLALTAAVALAMLLASCAHSPSHEGEGVVHTVRRGENVFRIAAYYRVSVSEILEANRIRDERALQVGEQLWIPEAYRSPPGFALLPPPATQGDAPRRAREEPIRDGALSFVWPVKGRLTGIFGTRNGRRHEGIDLAAKPGTLIRASESGRVIYSGNGLGAYGNVVIVRHSKRYVTVYAHNRKNRVRKGSFVDKGDVIAEVGETGNATGPHLHFEVRCDERARDPLDFLP
jgi:murein DD-endopeptidase MepM/ murein hydrolase activator NlpD